MSIDADLRPIAAGSSVALVPVHSHPFWDWLPRVYDFCMVAAVRQIIKVEANGRIEILAPELRAGTMAEVIVLLPSVTQVSEPRDRVAALSNLRKSIGLSAAAADEWVRNIRDERDTWKPASGN
jgi:hypothetical protein